MAFTIFIYELKISVTNDRQKYDTLNI
jgi:hypothetical protein